MQSIADTLSQVGVFGYLVVSLSLLANGMSIAALIISLAAKRRKFGVIFGLIAGGLSAGAILVGCLGYAHGMAQVAAAMEAVGRADRVMVLLSGKSIAASVAGLGLLGGGLPLTLSLLALLRAYTRPVTAPTREELAAMQPVPPAGSKGPAILAAILPGAMVLTGLGVALAATPDNADLMREGGPWFLLMLAFSLLVTPFICILGFKAIRGAAVPVSVFVLLALQPWLVSLTGKIWGFVQLFEIFDSLPPDARASVFASGMFGWLSLQYVGPYLSALLLIGGALPLAMAAATGTEGRRLPARWIVAGLGGALMLGFPVPLLILRGGSIPFIFAILPAAAAVFIGIGFAKTREPKHRGATLGVSAAFMAGLGVAGLFQTAAAMASFRILDTAAVMAAANRFEMIRSALTELGGVLTLAGPAGWTALLPALAAGGLVAITLPRRRPTAGAILAACLTLGVLGFNQATGRLGDLPDEVGDVAPWKGVEEFSPIEMSEQEGCTVTSSMNTAWIIGRSRSLIDGIALPGGPGDPAVDAALEETLQRLSMINSRIGGSGFNISVAIDVAGNADHVRVLMELAQRHGFRRIDFVGTRQGAKPTLPQSANGLPFIEIFQAGTDDACYLPVEIPRDFEEIAQKVDAAKSSTHPWTAGNLVRTLSKSHRGTVPL